MSKTKCEKCAYIQDSPLEDMALISSKRLKEEYKFADALLPYADKLLCDDCYTELRYYIADELDILLQEVNL
jgi:hypothetical protein|tara:strand:- start:422 stop:637 length:216 start_codon:yes stop_codon:yes gene_type:complete